MTERLSTCFDLQIVVPIRLLRPTSAFRFMKHLLPTRASQWCTWMLPRFLHRLWLNRWLLLPALAASLVSRGQHRIPASVSSAAELAFGTATCAAVHHAIRVRRNRRAPRCRAKRFVLADRSALRSPAPSVSASRSATQGS